MLRAECNEVEKYLNESSRLHSNNNQQPSEFYLMIDAATKEQLKEKLLKEEERLKHELSQFTKRIGGGMGYAPEFPNLGTSEEDSSFEVQEYTLSLDLQRKLEKDLGLVRKALRKMEEGGYGSCESCGNMVALERLEVIPEAQYCSDCFGKDVSN